MVVRPRHLAPRAWPRLVRALAITLLLGGIGIVTAATVSNPPEDSLLLRLPPIKAGDEGLYEKVALDRQGNAKGPGVPHVRFQVMGPVEILDDQGQPHAALRVDQYNLVNAMPNATRFEARVPTQGTHASQFFVDIRTGSILAMGERFRAQAVGNAEGSPAGFTCGTAGCRTGYNTTFIYENTYLSRRGPLNGLAPAELRGRQEFNAQGDSTRFAPGFSDRLPVVCGLINALQGKEVSLAGSFSVLPDFLCGQGQGVAGPAQPFFLPAGTGHVLGMETIKLQQPGPDGIVLHMVPELAYPVAITVNADFNSRETLVLAGFSPGRLVRVPEPSGTSMPVASLAGVARHRWGPDEQGMPGPFLLAEAFQRARDDPRFSGLRDYLARHPAAAVYQAHLQTTSGNYSTWTFALHADSERAAFCVSKGSDFYDAVSPLGFLGYAVNGGDRCPDVPIRSQYPEPAQLPAMLPPVAAALPLWTTYAEGKQHSIQQLVWGFDFTCVQASCEEPVFTLWLGQVEEEDRCEGKVLLLCDASHERTTHSLVLDEALRPVAIWDRLARFNASSAPDQMGPAPPPPKLGPTVAYAGDGWEHGAVAAGAGLGALLAGLAYLLWPTLKAAGLALFSRIEDEKALAHPKRLQVMTLVRELPGIHVQEIARRANMARSTVEHHLRILAQCDLVSVHRGRHYTCYFPCDDRARMPKPVMGALKSDGAQATLRAASGSPGISPAHIAKAIGISRQAVAIHLRTLAGVGAVSMQRDGRRLRVHALQTGTDQAEVDSVG